MVISGVELDLLRFLSVLQHGFVFVTGSAVLVSIFSYHLSQDFCASTRSTPPLEWDLFSGLASRAFWSRVCFHHKVRLVAKVVDDVAWWWPSASALLSLCFCTTHLLVYTLPSAHVSATFRCLKSLAHSDISLSQTRETYPARLIVDLCAVHLDRSIRIGVLCQSRTSRTPLCL